MRVIFVRHGQYATFNVLTERCQLLDDVDVRWDRRLGADRRFEQRAIANDKRLHERRKPASPDVLLRGYTVASLPDAPDSLFKR
jgi:hypothetical protein